MPGSLQPWARARHTLPIHSPPRTSGTHGSASGLHPAGHPGPSQTGDTEPRSGALSTSATRKARAAKVRSGARPLTSLPPASRNAPRQPCLSTRRGSAGRAFQCLPEGSAPGGMSGWTGMEYQAPVRRLPRGMTETLSVTTAVLSAEYPDVQAQFNT